MTEPNYIYESDTWNGVGDSTITEGTTYNFQSFTALGGHNIKSVILRLSRYGSPGTLNIGIKAVDINGNPTGDDLCSGSINGNSITDNGLGADYEITLGSGANLTANTKYAIVIKATSGDANNCVYWYYALAYAGGVTGYSFNAGSTWTQRTNDAVFQVLGTPPHQYSGKVFTARCRSARVFTSRPRKTMVFTRRN